MIQPQMPVVPRLGTLLQKECTLNRGDHTLVQGGQSMGMVGALPKFPAYPRAYAEGLHTQGPTCSTHQSSEAAHNRLYLTDGETEAQSREDNCQAVTVGQGALPSVLLRAGLQDSPHSLLPGWRRRATDSEWNPAQAPAPSATLAASLGGEVGTRPGPFQGRRLQGWATGEERLRPRVPAASLHIYCLISPFQAAEAAIAISPHFPGEETKA